MEPGETGDVAASNWWGFVLRTLENALQGDVSAMVGSVITGLLAIGIG